MARSSGLTRNLGLLILRVGSASMLFLGHGWPKITHFAEVAEKFPNPIGLGGTPSLVLVVFAEVFCSLLVALGLLTRFVLVPLVIFFAVAIFRQHLHDPFGRKELAIAYGIVFLSLLFTGPGRFSLDAWLGREGE